MAKIKEIKDPMDAILANIEKQMGNKNKTTLFNRFKNIKTKDIPVISFGIPEIDDASYCGGVPRGKMIELFGHESSGKSLLSLYLIASAQRQGLECALIDLEQAFDPIWATQHGVDVDSLVWGNDFESGEQALEYAFQICKSKAFGLVIIDSTAALTPLSELEGSLEDNARVGEQARLLSRGCRKIRSACGNSGTTCIFINQIRMKIGVMWGNPETTPGGKALKFYSDMRIQTRGKGKIKLKENNIDKVIGQTSSVTFVKNRVGRPFGQAEFSIIFDPQSLNPVVMLCKELKNNKLIRTYKGILNIPKEVMGNKTKIETCTTTLVELADYLIEQKMVLPLLDVLIDTVLDINMIDDAILEMKEDNSLIVSPSDKAVIDVNRVEDTNNSEFKSLESKELEIEYKEEELEK